MLQIPSIVDCLSLPHPKTLQQLYSKIGLESDFTTFLKQLTAYFTSKERNLILHMNEVHVNSTVAYTEEESLDVLWNLIILSKQFSQ